MKHINLLPEDGKLILKFLTLREIAWSLFKFTLFLLFIIFIIFGTSWWYSYMTTKSLQKELDVLAVEQTKSDYGVVREKIQGINARIADASFAFSSIPAISEILDAIVSVVPEGVFVQSFVFSVEKRQLAITGFSLNRDGVLLLHEDLSNKKEFFESVDYPLENLSKPINTPFSFSVVIKKELLNISRP